MQSKEKSCAIDGKHTEITLSIVQTIYLTSICQHVLGLFLQYALPDNFTLKLVLFPSSRVATYQYS